MKFCGRTEQMGILRDRDRPKSLWWLMVVAALFFAFVGPASAEVSWDCDLNATPEPVAAGDVLTYEISITNVGDETAQWSGASLQLPAEVSALYTQHGSIDGQNVFWDLGSVEPGETFTDTVTARVNWNLEYGFSLTATAYVYSEQPFAEYETQVSSTVTTPVWTGTLTPVPDPVSPGQTLTYELVLTNSGGGSTSSVFLTLTLPPEVSYVSSDQGEYMSDSHHVSWYPSEIPPGGQFTDSIVVEVSETVAPGDTFTAEASVLCNELPDYRFSATSTVAMQGSPDIALGFSSVPVLDSGEEFEVTISYTNTGDGPATNSELTLSLPEHVTYLGSSPAGSMTDNFVSIPVGDIPAEGGSGEVIVRLRAGDVLEGETVTESVDCAIHCTETKPFWGSFQVSIGSGLRVTISSDRSRSRPCQTITYTVSLINDGSLPAKGVAVRVPIPEFSRYVPAQGFEPVDQEEVSWYIASLPAERTAQLQFQVKVDQNIPAGSVLLQTWVDVEVEDPSLVLQSAPVNVVVTRSYIESAKRTAVERAYRGEEIQYSIVVSNVSASNVAYDAFIVDFLPEGMSYVPGSSLIDGYLPLGEPTDSPGNKLTWHIGDIPAGSIVTLSYKVLISPTAKLGRLTNRARAGATAEVLQTDSIDGQIMYTSFTEASCFILPGLSSESGTVLGQVYVDNDGDGRFNADDEPLAYMRLVMEDGTVVITDELGRYSIPGVIPGQHAIALDVDSIRETLPDFSSQAPEVFYMSPGGLKRIDFRLSQ